MEAALAVCRFAHFLGAMIAFGVGAFACAFAPAPLRAAISPRLRPLAIAAAAVALVSGVVWLALEAASMSEDWNAALDFGAVTDVLAGTSFGTVWQARLPIALALLVALAFSRRDRWGLPTAIAFALLASLALVDHGAMQTGALGLAHRCNDALHLVVAAGWLGGLIPFIACLRAFDDERLREDAVTAMMGFSAAGHFGVLALIASGAVNIALTSHAAPWPPLSPYRALLIAKIAVVAIMVAVALFNRYGLVPRVEPGASALRALRMTSVAEVSAAIVVVALVSVFGLLDPS